MISLPLPPITTPAWRLRSGFRLRAEQDALGRHGHTAAEIIHARADAAKPNMGLTTWIGSRPQGRRVGGQELSRP